MCEERCVKVLGSSVGVESRNLEELEKDCHSLKRMREFRGGREMLVWERVRRDAERVVQSENGKREAEVRLARGI